MVGGGSWLVSDLLHHLGQVIVAPSLYSAVKDASMGENKPWKYLQIVGHSSDAGIQNKVCMKMILHCANGFM